MPLLLRRCRMTITGREPMLLAAGDLALGPESSRSRLAAWSRRPVERLPSVLRPVSVSSGSDTQRAPPPNRRDGWLFCL